MNRNSLILISGAVILLIVVGVILVNLAENKNTTPIAGRASLDTTTIPAGNLVLPTGVPKPSGSTTSSQKLVQVQDSPAVSPDQAKNNLLKAFPQFNPYQVNVTYSSLTRYSPASYVFDLLKNNESFMQGGLNPATGSIDWYAIGIKRIGRPEKPAITLETAQYAAEKEIESRNGILSLNKSEARYDPLGMPDSGGIAVAGTYVFVYDRLIKTTPCNSDGFTVAVDSISGAVVEYRKTWIKPPEEIC